MMFSKFWPEGHLLALGVVIAVAAGTAAAGEVAADAATTNASVASQDVSEGNLSSPISSLSNMSVLRDSVPPTLHRSIDLNASGAEMGTNTNTSVDVGAQDETATNATNTTSPTPTDRASTPPANSTTTVIVANATTTTLTTTVTTGAADTNATTSKPLTSGPHSTTTLIATELEKKQSAFRDGWPTGRRAVPMGSAGEEEDLPARESAAVTNHTTTLGPVTTNISTEAATVTNHTTSLEPVTTTTGTDARLVNATASDTKTVDQASSPALYVTHGPTRSVAFLFVVQGVDYEELSVNKDLTARFETALREAIAARAGNGITSDDVAVALSAGSVLVSSNVSVPSIADHAVRSRLCSAGDAAMSIAHRINATDGIEMASTGPITIDALHCEEDSKMHKMKGIVGGVVGGTLGALTAGLLGGLLHSINLTSTTLGATLENTTTATLTTTMSTSLSLAVLNDRVAGNTTSASHGFLATQGRRSLHSVVNGSGPSGMLWPPALAAAASEAASEFRGLSRGGRTIALTVVLGSGSLGLLLFGFSVLVKMVLNREGKLAMGGSPWEHQEEEDDGTPHSQTSAATEEEKGEEREEKVAGGCETPSQPITRKVEVQRIASANSVPWAPQSGFTRSLPSNLGAFGRPHVPTATSMFSPLPQTQPFLHPVVLSPRGGYR